MALWVQQGAPGGSPSGYATILEDLQRHCKRHEKYGDLRKARHRAVSWLGLNASHLEVNQLQKVTVRLCAVGMPFTTTDVSAATLASE